MLWISKDHKQNFTNLRFSVKERMVQLLTASQASIHSLYTSTGSDRKLIVAYKKVKTSGLDRKEQSLH